MWRRGCRGGGPPPRGRGAWCSGCFWSCWPAPLTRKVELHDPFAVRDVRLDAGGRPAEGVTLPALQVVANRPGLPEVPAAAHGPVRGPPEEGTDPGSREAMRQQDEARCPWAKTELYVQYHDTEWGVPVHDDRLLFEFLILEGAQAGLSWETILKKRENYREAFDQFDPAVIARYGGKKQRLLLSNPGIVRNRLKIEATIQNAKAFLAVQKEWGTFDEFIWKFVSDQPIQNAWKSMKEVPSQTKASDAMSKDLKQRGFKF